MNTMRGYVGLTDPEWYEYLASRPRVDEVNFWQPHGDTLFKAIRPGEPFFFKLRAPLRAIAGFGFFQRFERLPAWLAWDSFGDMNGAPDLAAMLDRINRLRREDGPADRTGAFHIGCLLIEAPVFFRPDEWVLPPDDWAKTGIQKGKTYDLAEGEGRRVLQDCVARAQAPGRHWNVEPLPAAAAGVADRYGAPMLVRPRLGQGLFRLDVRDAYAGACAVTGEHSGPVLEAAHIMPYARGGEHRVDNGLLLRRDLHRLFDLGYVTITPGHEFRVGDSLRDEFQNGRSYYGLAGSRIHVPENPGLQPQRELLEWHGREIFKG